jgi:hypothetical protein
MSSAWIGLFEPIKVERLESLAPKSAVFRSRASSASNMMREPPNYAVFSTSGDIHAGILVYPFKQLYAGGI